MCPEETQRVLSRKPILSHSVAEKISKNLGDRQARSYIYAVRSSFALIWGGAPPHFKFFACAFFGPKGPRMISGYRGRFSHSTCS